MVLFLGLFSLASCNNENPDTNQGGGSIEEPNTNEQGASFLFKFYEKDNTPDDLTDNKVVSSYTITYDSSKEYAIDAFYSQEKLANQKIKITLTKDSQDYIVASNGSFGLFIESCYISNYDKCANNKEYPLEWSMLMVNGVSSNVGISGVKVEGLTELAFVIDGWK